MNAKAGDYGVGDGKPRGTPGLPKKPLGNPRGRPPQSLAGPIGLQIGDEMFVGTFRGDRIAYFALR